MELLPLSLLATTIDKYHISVQTGSLDVGKIASIAVNIPDSESMLAGSSYTITVEADNNRWYNPKHFRLL